MPVAETLGRLQRSKSDRVHFFLKKAEKPRYSLVDSV